MIEETNVPEETPAPEAPEATPEPQAAPEAPAPQAPPPAAEAPAAPEPAAVDSKEVEEGKVFAVLSYVLSLIGLPFFLVPLIMRNNEFSLYHSKQSLLICLAGIALSIVGVPLIAICIGAILLPIGGILLFVLAVIGAIHASKGEMVPVPLIGKLAVDWFKGIKKV